MTIRKSDGALTQEERRIVKALLNSGWRNQDIQAFLNTGRQATINSTRITEVKKNGNIKPASPDELKFFEEKKKSFDLRTGLSIYGDERLIRSREAMILAVNAFNNPAIAFKTEVFAMLACVAWTYLLHEYYDRKKVKIVGGDGRSLLLSQMIKRGEVPLTVGIKNNIAALIVIRDTVEHLLLAKSDAKWSPLYQACCLNYDKVICQMFGERLSLRNELAFAIQFSKLSIEQVVEIQKFDVPAQIEALDARLNSDLTEEQRADLEYQFRVVYTLDNASKSQSHMHFVHPESEEAEHVRNVLVKYELADDGYPFRPSAVVKLVAKRSGRRFTAHNHTQAWHYFKVRPKISAKQPHVTDRNYCVFHKAHKDYTYSLSWVEFLSEQWKSNDTSLMIMAVKV
tara:strand:- start:236 stop:1429 length:1194 start_codon:yes stop_codon:yes gene_type:complete